MRCDSNGKKLVFAVSLIRHGDRAPYAKIDGNNVECHWPNGIGELTPEGMHQEYLLGKKLRERYVSNLHLLAPEYKASSICVLSTSYTRTIMSAQSCLAGLYPNGTGQKFPDGSFALPDGYQPIPIYTIGNKEKNILNPEFSHPDQFHRLMNYDSMNQPDWILKNNELASNFERWSKNLGVKITGIYDLMLPGDTLFCMSEHNMPLPAGLSREDADKIIETYLYVCLTRVAPKAFIKFMAEGFISKLSKDLQSAAEGKHQYKYILYSGHDISIVAVMNALGCPPAKNPPYASHLAFELYQDNSEYLIKVFYNGDFIEFPKGSGKTSYALNEFQDLIAPFLEK